MPLKDSLRLATRPRTMADAFTSRLAHVFGALDKHDPQASLAPPSWHVSNSAVHQAGKDSDESSTDGEDEHIEAMQVCYLVFDA